MPGNDDLGEMSSWYVWSAIGMYPEIPGRAELVLGSPLWIGGVEKAAATPAPKLGEHSTAILREHGFADEEIAHLRAQGVVG